MRILAVCGATATGKTALAVECAKRLNGEIISCDALLVYRGLNIGTAKPTKEEMQGIEHYLIDVADPYDNFSVSDFEALAIPKVEEIASRGKTPILCGGTGFYMNSVLYSRSFGSAPADEAVREKYRAIAETAGKEEVYRILTEKDPLSAAALHPNDLKRVIRALEIFETTGKRKSEQHDEAKPRYDFVAVAYDYPREELYLRIDKRVDEMLERGLVEEVRGLLKSGVPEKAQCMQGIGYKEVVEFLKNKTLQSTMSDIIKKNTRNYAKRQLTFFKKMQNLHWLQPGEASLSSEEVCRIYEG